MEAHPGAAHGLPGQLRVAGCEPRGLAQQGQLVACRCRAGWLAALRCLLHLHIQPQLLPQLLACSSLLLLLLLGSTRWPLLAGGGRPGAWALRVATAD